MTAKELAVELNGVSYGRELTRQKRREIAESGLVAVFGYSDDGMEFVGAIDDEVSAFGGTTVYINKNGILTVPDDHCDMDECPYLKQAVKEAWSIKAVWRDDGDPCWTYETDIPHEKFLVFEDEETLFCEGIVFRVQDL